MIDTFWRGDCLPTENVPRELATCFREVLDNGGTIHSEPYGEPAPSPSPWPEQHEVGVDVILPCSYITRPEAQYVETHCFLNINESRKQEDQCHINRISMTVYFSLMCILFCVFHFRCSVYTCTCKTLIFYCYFIRMLTSQLIFDPIWHNNTHCFLLWLVCSAVKYK